MPPYIYVNLNERSEHDLPESDESLCSSMVSSCVHSVFKTIIVVSFVDFESLIEEVFRCCSSSGGGGGGA